MNDKREWTKTPAEKRDELSEGEKARISALQTTKSPYDSSSDPRPYSEAEFGYLVSTFIRTWQYGLLEPVKVRGMAYSGKIDDNCR